MLFPKLVPAGSSYVKIPISKRAAMRILLETVQRGSRYWIAGSVSPDKALGFAAKMAKRYHADATQAQRAYAKSQDKANTTLLMYPEHAGSILWWLLATPGKGDVHEQEQLLDAHHKRTPLTWETQYELVHAQRPRPQGGGRHWTWRLADQRYAELDAAMRELAASPGHARARHDDLDGLVQALMRMPGFHGMRMQVLELLRVGKEAWSRTHAKGHVYPWPENVSYLDKGFVCYHAPNPLRLDVLAQSLAEQPGRHSQPMKVGLRF
ncbi:MAG: hypothetical protein H6935_08930 [Thiobacillus sp.]|nr:hypothetical protein [Thiobacillus sp.]